MSTSGVKYSWAKCSEGLSNRVSNIISIYIYIYIYTYIGHMKFAAYIDFSFIPFFHILLVPFLSLYIWLYVLFASV